MQHCDLSNIGVVCFNQIDDLLHCLSIYKSPTRPNKYGPTHSDIPETMWGCPKNGLNWLLGCFKFGVSSTNNHFYTPYNSQFSNVNYFPSKMNNQISKVKNHKGISFLIVCIQRIPNFQQCFLVQILPIPHEMILHNH